MSEFDTFQRKRPVCPHCGHLMTTDEMLDNSDDDLFALASDEGRACIECPVCDKAYWVQGGYVPHYTSAFAEEEL